MGLASELRRWCTILSPSYLERTAADMLHLFSRKTVGGFLGACQLALVPYLGCQQLQLLFMVLRCRCIGWEVRDAPLPVADVRLFGFVGIRGALALFLVDGALCLFQISGLSTRCTRQHWVDFCIHVAVADRVGKAFPLSDFSGWKFLVVLRILCSAIWVTCLGLRDSDLWRA